MRTDELVRLIKEIAIEKMNEQVRVVGSESPSASYAGTARNPPPLPTTPPPLPSNAARPSNVPISREPPPIPRTSSDIPHARLIGRPANSVRQQPPPLPSNAANAARPSNVPVPEPTGPMARVYNPDNEPTKRMPSNPPAPTTSTQSTPMRGLKDVAASVGLEKVASNPVWPKVGKVLTRGTFAVGSALAAKDAYDAYKEGDYKGAALSAAEAIPVVGLGVTAARMGKEADQDSPQQVDAQEVRKRGTTSGAVEKMYQNMDEQLINRGSYMPHKPRYRSKIKRRLIEDDAVPVENKKQKSDAVVVNPEINSFVNNR